MERKTDHANAAAPVKLIALDLDGTLLDSEKRLSAANAQALARAAGAGIEIVPATGRFYRGIPEPVRSLPFVRYAITINGAEVWDVQACRAVSTEELSAELSVQILRFLDGLPAIYDCYQDGWGWMTQTHYDSAATFAANRHSLEMIRKLRSPVPELKAELLRRGCGVQKLQAFFRDTALRDRTVDALRERFPAVEVTTSMSNNIEINSRAATKGNGLRRLAEHLGIPLAQTAAVGDARNDLSMLQAAGVGVAMGNASEEIRSAAAFVTDDCDRDGAARAVARLCAWAE